MVTIRYEKHTLSNGLDLILHEDHALPIVAVNVWYHVGSKDEEVGRTGFAHLFEHVMFEGSKHHNRSYFDPLQKAGALLNGSTTTDRTNYWENVPANYLELALWLEADRMGFLLDALDQKRFDVQRDVVKNERRQSYENRPYGMAHMMLQPAVFPSPHPYNWMTIGVPEDLDAADLEDVKGFFRRFYAPSNASLAIAGDIDPDDVLRKVERYFGDIPPGPAITRVGRMDSDLRGQISLTMRDKVQLPRLYLVWPTAADFDADQASLDMLSVILADGKSSRLYQSLVYEKQIASDIGAMDHAKEIAGEFHIQVTASPGHTLEKVESVVWDELRQLQDNPPDEDEVARAKNRIQSHQVRALERVGGFGGRADQLNYYNTMAGDPGAINTDIDRHMAVTAEDIQRVASSRLGESYVRLSVLPEQAHKPAATSINRSLMPEAGPTPAFAPPVPRRSKLPNGLGIMFVEKPGLPLVSFGLLLRAGATGDPVGRPGLAHMTASLLSEGTSTRSSKQIANEMEFLGSQLGAMATRQNVLVVAETLTANWPAALEILTDVVQNPTFPPEELERVRKEHLTDLSRVADSPVAIASRAARALLYGSETSHGHPVSGTEESVRAMTRDEIVEHYAARYSPQNTTLLVVGDVTESDVIARAEAYLGNWTAASGSKDDAVTDADPQAIESTTIFFADKPGAAQSVISAGHVTIPRSHADYHPMSLLNYIFGGQFSARLNMNLRQDKGYSYGYSSSIDWSKGPSALLAGGGVQTAVTKEAVAETFKEFTEVREKRPVTQEELDDAKDGILKGLPAQFESQAQTLQQLTRLLTFDLPDDYFSSFAAELGAVSLEDVHRVAKELVHDGRLSVLVVGDREAVESDLNELGYPIVPVDYEGRRLQ